MTATINRQLPIELANPMVQIWEGPLQNIVGQILTRSKVSWRTCGLYRYGATPNVPKSCPPTIIITSTDIQNSDWANIKSRITVAMSEVHFVGMLVVLQDDVIDSAGIWPQTPNPYNSPRQLGESCSIHCGPVSQRANATLGGCIKLTKGVETKLVCLTNNHAVNEQPKNAQWDELTFRSVVSPSDFDHYKSQRPNLWLPAANKLLDWFAANPDKDDPTVAIGPLSDELLKTKEPKPPITGDDALSTKWRSFLEAKKSNLQGGILDSLKALTQTYQAEILLIYLKLTLDQFKPDQSPVIIDLCSRLTVWTPAASAALQVKNDWATLQNEWIRMQKDESKAAECLGNIYKSSAALCSTIDLNFLSPLKKVAETIEYQKADTISQRKVGRTFAASGRCTTQPKAPIRPCILDWALVEIEATSKPFENVSPALQKFAKEVFQADQRKKPEEQRFRNISCKLAGDTVLRVTEITDPVPDGIVFKIGRTTGCTVGLINTTQTIFNPVNKIGNGWQIGQEDFASTKEWEAVSVADFTHTGEDILGQKFAAKGDSGSWILDPDGKLVGLQWGVNDFGVPAFFTPIREVFYSIEKMTGWKPSLPT